MFLSYFFIFLAVKLNSNFFDSQLPYEIKSCFFNRFLSISNNKIVSFFSLNCNFELIFVKKKVNLNKNYFKSEQNHAKYTVFKQPKL